MATVMEAQPATGETPKQPDISYIPNHAKYLARTARRLATENLPRTLPAGFPARIEGPLAWRGVEIAETYPFVHELAAADVAEIERALVHFKQLGLPLGAISPETFPLPTLRARLRALSAEVHDGRGFGVVRGLPVAGGRPRADAIAACAGVACHVAPRFGRQDRVHEGRDADVLLTHIVDLSAGAAPGIGSPAYTRDAQVFHTDVGDVVALMALGVPESGGGSLLASVGAVYNELASTRPDLIATLAQPWPAEEFAHTSAPYTLRAPLHLLPATAAPSRPARVAMHCGRRYFTGYGALARSASVPPISEAMAEALDAVHFTAARVALRLEFKVGDMQFVNNMAVLHAREGYVDGPGKQRHLVRLWLRDPERSWETPAGPLRERWARVYDGVRAERSVFPLEPVVRSEGLKDAKRAEKGSGVAQGGGGSA